MLKFFGLVLFFSLIILFGFVRSDPFFTIEQLTQPPELIRLLLSAPVRSNHGISWTLYRLNLSTGKSYVFKHPVEWEVNRVLGADNIFVIGPRENHDQLAQYAKDRKVIPDGPSALLVEADRFNEAVNQYYSIRGPYSILPGLARSWLIQEEDKEKSGYKLMGTFSEGVEPNRTVLFLCRYPQHEVFTALTCESLVLSLHSNSNLK